MATYESARNMGREAELGSIAPGMRADMLLVDGDPRGRSGTSGACTG